MSDSEAAASATDSTGVWSLSWMVPTAHAATPENGQSRTLSSTSSAPIGSLNFNKNSSSFSDRPSLIKVTSTVLSVSPGANVSVSSTPT